MGKFKFADDALFKKEYLNKTSIVVLILSTLIINLCALVIPLVTLQIYDRILNFHSIGTLNVLISGAVIIVILDTILKFCRHSLIGWSTARFEHAAYSKILRRLMQSRFGSFKEHSNGETLQRINAIARLKSFYSGQSLTSLIDLPFVFIFLGFIGYLSGILVTVPIIMLALFGIYASYLAKSMKQTLVLRDKDNDTRTHFLSEVLNHIHTTKMLGLEHALQRRYEALQGENIADSYALNLRNAQSINATTLFTQIMMISMISIGALLVLSGQISMGVLIACVLLSGRIMQPVQRALAFWISFQDYHLAQDKIKELLALPVLEKKEIPNDTARKGKLIIENLHFTHKTSTKPLFSGLNLTLQPGKAIALLGPPGDGKTSLMKLIAGLHLPLNGNIIVDGLEVSSIPHSEIPRYIGYLPSESEIFQGTIMENLTSFRPELEEQAKEISALLGIDKIVSKLAAGYRTQLFDVPADPITPGMKQRITIGRVLINRPRILLLDFADKSLDKEGYNHLFRLLGQIKGQASMILVSNDRNILHLAQEEYIIDKGIIVPNNERYEKSGDIARPLKELTA